MTNRVTRQLDTNVWTAANWRIDAQVGRPICDRMKRVQHQALVGVLCCQLHISFVELFQRGLLEPLR